MKAIFGFWLAVCAAVALRAQGDFESLSRQAASALAANPAEAAKLYRQALDMRPGWAEGWFYLGASLYELQRYGESEQAFHEAAKLAPDNGTVWAFLGLSEYQAGEYQQAWADLRKGEDLGLGNDKPFISSIRNHAALICLRASNFGGAMEQLEPLARIGDDSTATIEDMGVSVLGAPYLPPQIPAEKKAIVELAGRAAWGLSRERPDEARPFLDQLRAKYPKEAGVHYLYGLYLVAQDPEAALNQFRQEIEIRPSYVPARLQAAQINLMAGRLQNALKLGTEALRLEPGNPYCELITGRAYLRLGQTDKAEAAFEAAARLAPDNPQPHFYLAQIYHRAGKNAEAEREQAEYKRLKTVLQPIIF